MQLCRYPRLLELRRSLVIAPPCSPSRGVTNHGHGRRCVRGHRRRQPSEDVLNPDATHPAGCGQEVSAAHRTNDVHKGGPREKRLAQHAAAHVRAGMAAAIAAAALAWTTGTVGAGYWGTDQRRLHGPRGRRATVSWHGHRRPTPSAWHAPVSRTSGPASRYRRRVLRGGGNEAVTARNLGARTGSELVASPLSALIREVDMACMVSAR